MVRTAERTVVTTLLDFRFAFMVEYLNVVGRGRGSVTTSARRFGNACLNGIKSFARVSGFVTSSWKGGKAERQSGRWSSSDQDFEGRLTRGEGLLCARKNT
jgi:hypothetical protein